MASGSTHSQLQMNMLDNTGVEGFPLQDEINYYFDCVRKEVETVNKLLTSNMSFNDASLAVEAIIAWNLITTKANDRLRCFLKVHGNPNPDGSRVDITSLIFDYIQMVFLISPCMSGPVTRMLRISRNQGTEKTDNSGSSASASQHAAQSLLERLSRASLTGCIKAHQADQDFTQDELRWADYTKNPCLKYTIHPVFCRANFDSRVDYDALKPTLRLASRLLRAAFPLLQTHILGQLTKGPKIQGTDESLGFIAQVEGALRSEQIEEALLALSQVVSFYMGRTMEHKDDLGLCYYRWQKGYMPPPLRGAYSEIAIRADLLEKAYIPTGRTSWPNERYVWPLNSFIAARTLVHELFHAVVYAIRPESCDTKFFADGCSTSEEGFEFESSLFGDATLLFDESRRLVSVAAWPEEYVVQHYGTRMVVRQGVTSLSHGDILVPREFVSQLSTNSFWDKRNGSFEAFGKLSMGLEGTPQYTYTIGDATQTARANSGRPSHHTDL